MTFELTIGWIIALFIVSSLGCLIFGIVIAFLWIARDDNYQKVDSSQIIIEKTALDEFIKGNRSRRGARIPEAGSYVTTEEDD